jgi:glycine/D-amino acid oxidase-like deaminating enzyme
MPGSHRAKASAHGDCGGSPPPFAVPASRDVLQPLNPEGRSMSSPQTQLDRWGQPPWEIDFTPARQPLPQEADFAVIGAGFTGLAAATSLRLMAPEKSVVVFEAGRIGHGASGRTGGMVLAESAAGDLPGLGDVLTGLQRILAELSRASGVPIIERAELLLPGAWEIARKQARENSPIEWDDTGTLRVVNEVPGGTLNPGKMVESLARAAEGLGAIIVENARVNHVRWAESGGEVSFEGGKILARKILIATNAFSLEVSAMHGRAHPKLTLAAMTAPIREEKVADLGLAERKPFYTVDFPYLWGRICPDNSIVWGAGLVTPPESGDVEQIDIAAGESARMFATLERRIRHLKPGFEDFKFTHLWGGPILFRDNWTPVFTHHPESRDGIVLGAFAGHGVALSSYLGHLAAETMLGRRDLPKWGALK